MKQVLYVCDGCMATAPGNIGYNNQISPPSDWTTTARIPMKVGEAGWEVRNRDLCPICMDRLTTFWQTVGAE